jgi:NO-binding membrane sensor protein with MHYT domain
MAKKFKKQSKSVPFSFSRWFSKISTAQPSAFTISLITLAFAVFLFGGGLWAIINYATIQPAVYAQGKFYFLYPGLGNQFVSDTVIAVALYAMGFIGLLAIYQSTKYVYKPRQAYMTLIVGVTLLLLAYLFLENAIYIKMNYS